MAPVRSRKALTLLPVLALIGLSVACGATGDGTEGLGSGSEAESPEVQIPPAAKDEKLAAMVPPAIGADGKLSIGQDQTYAPNEFVDESGAVVGFDVDLGEAIGQKLGLQAEFTNASFDGIITGLAANKYEAGMSSFTINADRMQTVDMVSYYDAGTALAVLKGNPDNLRLDDLCGKNIAVQKGTTQVEDLQARSSNCAEAGKPPITMQQFQNQTDVNLQLISKRSQGMLADSPVIDYAMKQTGDQLKRIGEPYDSSPYGVALAKNNGALGQAVQGALRGLIEDGTYKKILDKWGLNAIGGVANPEINPQV